MPERKRFFSIDAFPYVDYHFREKMNQLCLLLVHFVLVKSDGDISHPYCFTKERPSYFFSTNAVSCIKNLLAISSQLLNTCQSQNQMWLVGVALKHCSTATTGIDLTPQSGHKKGGDRG